MNVWGGTRASDLVAQEADEDVPSLFLETQDAFERTESRPWGKARGMSTWAKHTDL